MKFRLGDVRGLFDYLLTLKEWPRKSSVPPEEPRLEIDQSSLDIKDLQFPRFHAPIQVWLSILDVVAWNVKFVVCT
jgi:hypothetical protein